MIFVQKVDIKEDVNVVPDIFELLRPLRIATYESLEEIIEWDLDLLEEILSEAEKIKIVEISQRLREIFSSVSVSPSAATILSSQRNMASDKQASNSNNPGMMASAKDWFLTSKVLESPPSSWDNCYIPWDNNPFGIHLESKFWIRDFSIDQPRFPSNRRWATPRGPRDPRSPRRGPYRTRNAIQSC